MARSSSTRSTPSRAKSIKAEAASVAEEHDLDWKKKKIEQLEEIVEREER